MKSLEILEIQGVFKKYNIKVNFKKQEKAFDDKAWGIRLEAYQSLGFTEKAFDDKDSDIRLEAYRNLGFTEKAFDDKDWRIRIEAEKYFKRKLYKLLKN